jgi:hypothetical protein
MSELFNITREMDKDCLIDIGIVSAQCANTVVVAGCPTIFAATAIFSVKIANMSHTSRALSTVLTLENGTRMRLQSKKSVLCSQRYQKEDMNLIVDERLFLADE